MFSMRALAFQLQTELERQTFAIFESDGSEVFKANFNQMLTDCDQSQQVKSGAKISTLAV
jgi:hypothetical protein